ncbi:hypothetical protein [Lysobacter sp. D1-1-M9]|uniref:hypothetical protein n=1 Tax=Novilysobacter longmucuonensis TaxID=3098603 RepID=UPI002FCC702A
MVDKNRQEGIKHQVSGAMKEGAGKITGVDVRITSNMRAEPAARSAPVAARRRPFRG